MSTSRRNAAKVAPPSKLPEVDVPAPIKSSAPAKAAPKNTASKAKKIVSAPAPYNPKDALRASVERGLIPIGLKVDEALPENAFGETALHAAAENGDVTGVQMLLAAGASVDALNEAGATALYLAAEEGHHDVVNALLEAGAKPSTADHEGWTPLHVASSGGHMQVAKLLLNKKADAAVRDKVDGNTPLHMASSQGNDDIVKLLLESKLGVNHQNNLGETALHKAARNGHASVAMTLLAAGADTDLRDTHREEEIDAATFGGHTALDLAKTDHWYESEETREGKKAVALTIMMHSSFKI
jgi:ankyrin repeat protein